MSRGIQRERQVRRQLEADGWWVARAAGSFGDADLVALKSVGLKAEFDYPQACLIEVKSTAAGPFHSFGPKCRQELLSAAEKAGAEAWLCWWAPRKQPVWLKGPEAWPGWKAA